MKGIANLSHHLGLLKVSGPKAKELLQGQLTCDLNEVTSYQATLGAHCNPKGRIISLFHLFHFHDAYYLQMPPSMVPIALNALKKYAIFYKVELTDASHEWNIIGYPTVSVDMSIKQGHAMIYPETSELFLPHEINLPQLNGVSFKKGCYTGQEIIARMQYRGKSKNQLYLATCENAMITRGMDIYDDQGVAGKIVDHACMENRCHLLIITHDHSKSLFLNSDRTQPIGEVCLPSYT